MQEWFIVASHSHPTSQIPAAVRQEVQQRGPCALHQTTVRTGHHSQVGDQHDAGFCPPPHQLAEVSEVFLYHLLVKRFVFVSFSCMQILLVKSPPPPKFFTTGKRTFCQERTWNCHGGLCTSYMRGFSIPKQNTWALTGSPGMNPFPWKHGQWG